MSSVCPICNFPVTGKSKSRKGYKRCDNAHRWFDCRVCGTVNNVQGSWNDSNSCANNCRIPGYHF